MADQFTLPETLKGIVKTGKGMSLQYPTNVKMWIEKFIVLKLCILYFLDAHREHLISFGSLINTLKMLFIKVNTAYISNISRIKWGCPC